MNPKKIAEMFVYCPNTGIIDWNPAFENHYNHHSQCGGSDGRGYIRIRYKKNKWFAHRLAWFLHYGAWPSGVIDHIDGVKTNNKITNLRDVDQSKNAQNQVRHRNGAPIGVGWHKHQKSGEPLLL